MKVTMCPSFLGSHSDIKSHLSFPIDILIISHRDTKHQNAFTQTSIQRHTWLFHNNNPIFSGSNIKEISIDFTFYSILIQSFFMESHHNYQSGFPAQPFAEYSLCCSAFQSSRIWTPLDQLGSKQQGDKVLVRGRVHLSRGKGNSCFLVLREGTSTLQACAFRSEAISKEMLKFMSSVPCQSIVDIVGTLVKPQKPIECCSLQIQLQIEKFYVVNRATHRLPLQIVDASRREASEEWQKEEQKQAQVGQQLKNEDNLSENSGSSKGKQPLPLVRMVTRLDNRVLDLRTPAKQAIFKLSSGVCQLFREFLIDHDFIEIHTPKLIGGTSEGGCNVFKLNYFNRPACLAQSPQIHKQMCVMADFQRVFEIGPIFRAENAMTHRHMCEFVGMDLEMTIKEHYFELLDFFAELFPFIFSKLQQKYAKQLKSINEQFPFQPFVCSQPVLRLTFAQGIQLLKENGYEWPPLEDLNTQMEKRLGQIVRKKYETDFYMLHRYPAAARPFYTMPCQDDPNYTCSYDFFMRGEEILSGAQRIHDPQLLTEQVKGKGINPETIKDYIDSFRYGAYPHGGGGIGLERVVMLYCGLKNIRNSSLFPRDPKRFTP